jgi:hypothetical protein
LTSLKKSTSTTSLDHIHEWRRQRRLIKATILDQLLADWFTKSLLPPIAQDVSMGGIFTKEQAINHAQYLDLVYSQSGTLYDLILHAPHPSTDPSHPAQDAHVDGMVGSVKTCDWISRIKKNHKLILIILLRLLQPTNIFPSYSILQGEFSPIQFISNLEERKRIMGNLKNIQTHRRVIKIMIQLRTSLNGNPSIPASFVQRTIIHETVPAEMKSINF